jgi:uncharacterized membrane protein YhaH (DUF805 family)
MKGGTMSTRRMAYWWFWLVVSGRFIEKFLNFAMREAFAASLRQRVRPDDDRKTLV